MPFQVGITNLVTRHKDWIAGNRLGLVSHSAAVDSDGRSSAEVLLEAAGYRLVRLFSPEHGYFSIAGAGVRCRNTRHPHLGLPIVSLYGTAKKPTPAMLRDIDTLVLDLQDLGARPYTYVSTLKLVLEAASQTGTEVIVTDRPIPLPRVCDGPVLDSRFRSFVSLLDVPMSYGMTPGETALWLRHESYPNLHLRVAGMTGCARESFRGPGWPPWIPPSPGIRSWESAMCYTATVFTEGLTAIDCGRKTNLAFQLIGSRLKRSDQLADMIGELRLPGIRFHRHCYDPDPNSSVRSILDGTRLTVTNPARFKPILTAVSIIYCLQCLCGKDRLWGKAVARPGFFDLLFGTDTIRKALMDGERPETIAAGWKRPLARFTKTRATCLLY